MLLSRPMPNPAFGSVEFIVAGSGVVEVAILDATGRVVRRLGEVSGRLAWDGRFDNGGPAPAGVFYIRATQGKETTTRRITLVR